MTARKSVFLVVFCLVISLTASAQTARPKATIEGSYKVTVDYSQDLEQMIAAGRYDKYVSNLTELQAWSLITPWEVKVVITSTIIEQGEQGQSMSVRIDLQDPIVRREIILVQFMDDVTVDEAIHGLKRLGMRPATVRELLALGAAYPEKQREFSIIALAGGIGIEYYPSAYFPVLFSWHGKRLFSSTFSHEFEWDDYGYRQRRLESRHYRFAAVRARKVG